MNRRRLICLAAPLAALFLLSGCGGGGGGGGSSLPSPFAGTWVGTWDAPSLSDDGTASITVATNGKVTGTTHDNGTDEDGTLSGSINNSGVFSGKAVYAGSPAINLNGTLGINGSGHLTGNVTQSQGSFSAPLTFDLIKQ